MVGPEHFKVAASYSNIGLVYSKQGKHQKALQHCQKSLDIKLRVFGYGNQDVARSYVNIRNVYQGKDDEALIQWTKMLEVL